MNKSLLEMIQRSRRFSFYFTMFVGLSMAPAGAVALDLTFPSDDCPAAAQVCVEQICSAGGGTLFVATGTHPLGNMVLNGRPLTNHIFARCSNFRMIGAGVDQTIVDATNSFDPPGKPSIAVGSAPFEPLSSKFDNIEVAHMTVKCDSNCTASGLGSLRTTNMRFHHLKVVGFPTGIFWRNADGTRIDHNEIHGRGPGTNDRGLQLAATGFECMPVGDVNDNLTGFHVIEHNLIVDATVGIDIDAMTDSTVAKNTILGGKVGIRARAGDNNVFEKNKIVGIDLAWGGAPAIIGAAGLSLRSSDRTVISKNLVCDTVSAPALRFEASDTRPFDLICPQPPPPFQFPFAELSRWPIFTNGNEDNFIEKNQFLGYDPNVCGVASGPNISASGTCFDAAFSFAPDGISNGGDNEFAQNVADPNGSCSD